MSFTDKFRAQHDEILALATTISDLLKLPEPDAAALRKQLSNLAGKVGFHLAMEDQALYPRLMERKGSRVEATANKFQTEMGGLAKVFTDYNSKWQLTAIRNDMAGFANETRKVFGALAHRITRETNELYPLADQGS
jgi:hypothetical protein